MRALVIGGTRFVGAAIVEELIGRGAEVTVFSRGVTNPERFAELDRVRGDRAADLDRLGDRRFDAVFDSCGYVPDVVGAAADRFADSGCFYVFVSSASAYRSRGTGGYLESDELAELDLEHPIDATANYGAAKVLCEQRLAAAFGDRLAVLRAGLIAGVGDYMDRFPYWVWRLGQPGEILCPGDGQDPAQMIDARDLARFAVELATARRPGVFNLTGPAEPATFADLLDAIAVGLGSERRDRVWAPASFLAEREVRPWVDMPCWVPRDHEASAILRVDITRALEAGLTLRPWSETAADTRAWLETENRSWPMDAGVSPERERELLAALR